MVAALGCHDGLILEHHGVLTVGRTVAEAFVLMHLLERAARSQLQAQAAGAPCPWCHPRQWPGSRPNGLAMGPRLKARTSGRRCCAKPHNVGITLERS